MGFKVFLLLGLVLAVSYAAPQAAVLDAEIEDGGRPGLDSLKELLAKLRERLEDLVDQDRPTPLEIIELIESIVADILDISDEVEQAKCLVQALQDLDVEEIREAARTIVRETINTTRLVAQRERELEECQAIGGDSPSVIDLLARTRCVNQVEVSLGTAITVSQIRRRAAVATLRSAEESLRTCIFA